MATISVTPEMEAFAAERRMELNDLAELLGPLVRNALALDDDDERLDALLIVAGNAFATRYGELVDAAAPAQAIDQFLGDMEPALALTEPDGTDAQVERIALWMSTASLGAATAFSSAPGASKTWFTMLDDDVRELHIPLHGDTVPLSGTFSVGAGDVYELAYPGQPVGPPEVWINCRCVLGIDVEAEELVAAATNGDDAPLQPDDEEEPPVPDDGPLDMEDDAELWWHGVIAPVGVRSGDGRTFGTLTWRDLPLPLEWQIQTGPEHDGSVVVGNHETIAQVGSEVRAAGRWANNEFAEQAIGLLSDGMIGSCSVQVDDGEAYADADGEGVTIDGRICATTLVNVGAFAECWVAMGPPPDGFFDDPAVTAAVESNEVEKGIAVVARPSSNAQPVDGGLPADELHVTLGYFGHTDERDDVLRQTLLDWVIREQLDTPIEASMNGVARMGHDDPQAVVALVEAPELKLLRESLEGVEQPDQLHPHFTPHMTLGYGIDMPDVLPETLTLERLELWWGPERLTGGDEEPDDIPADVTAGAETFRDYDTEQRREMAEKGWALPDGSFPIADLEDLRNAIQAIGRASDPEAAKAHIKKRARALGHTDLIPDTWSANTETFRRGRGWITHPEETARIHRYWTRGPGAAKIRWGTPGDFTRCTRQLRKYITPPFLNRTCAEWHHDALGYWPGERGRPGNPPKNSSLCEGECTVTTLTADGVGHNHSMQHTHSLHPAPGGTHTHGGVLDKPFQPNTSAVMQSLGLTAAAPKMPPKPRSWYSNPGLEAPTPLTVTPDGRVFGHIAVWGTCHIGVEGECIEPPKSATNYAHFHTGVVETDEGEIPCGVLTMGTGHAAISAGSKAAVQHYDDTGTQAAQVCAGEDEHGIWVAGSMMLMDEGDFARFRAAAVSGDWRSIGGNLELVASLMVNVPGFPIPRAALAASAGKHNALTAAGIVQHNEATVEVDVIELVASSVVKKIRAADARRERVAALNGTTLAAKRRRIAAIQEAVRV